MILTAGHVLALGAGALVLGCISFMRGLNSSVMWRLRLLAWLVLATSVLTAP